MKSKIKSLVLLLVAVVLITGCTMKENLNMKISSNKDVKASIIIAMDDEMIDAMISMKESGSLNPDESEKKTYTDEERWKYLESDDSALEVPDDFTTKRYDKDGFKGYVAEKNLGSIDSLSTTEAGERQNIVSDSDDEFFVGKLFIKDGTKYSSNMKIDLGDEAQDMSSYESYGAVFDMKLVIEFPKVPLSHNANEVSSDGKTLSWNLLKNQDVDFTFDFGKNGKVTDTKTDDIKNPPVEKQEKNNMTLYIIIGAVVGILLLVIIVVLIIVLVVVRKKPQPVIVEQTIQPAQPIPNQVSVQEQVIPQNTNQSDKPSTTNINIETNQTSTSETTTEVKESSEENVLDDTVQESAVVEENNDNNKETE